MQKLFDLSERGQRRPWSDRFDRFLLRLSNWFSACFRRIAPLRCRQNPEHSQCVPTRQFLGSPFVVAARSANWGGADDPELPARLFRLNPARQPQPFSPHCVRYGDSVITPRHSLVVCVSHALGSVPPGRSVQGDCKHSSDSERAAPPATGPQLGSGAPPTVDIAEATSYRFREALCAAKSLLHPGGLLQPTVMAQS
jgi:hypothetical protein